MSFYFLKTLVWVNQKKQRTLHTIFYYNVLFLICFQSKIHVTINDWLRPGYHSF